MIEMCNNTISPKDNSGYWGRCTKLNGHNSECVDQIQEEKMASVFYPLEHFGCKQLPAKNCKCDECYLNEIKQGAFILGARLALSEYIEAQNRT